MRMLARLWREYRSLVAFLVLMVLFRSAVADWNVVPSGSILPSIRLGDRIALRDNVLYVNGVRADYQPLGIGPLANDAGSPGEYYVERFDGVAHAMRLSEDAPSPRRSFGPLVVPAGEYLMLGDNRDDSADSRYFGFFPRKELMGRTRRVAFSLDPDHFYKPRFDRFGVALDAVAASAPLAAR